MTRQQKIKLISSLAGVIFSIFLASIYFVPLLKKMPKENFEHQKKIVPNMNYDSIMTKLLNDTTSDFRKSLDTILTQKNIIISNDKKLQN